jgi:hypothetical protein
LKYTSIQICFEFLSKLKRNQTPLVVAAELGHTEVAEVLINYGADLQMQEKV